MVERKNDSDLERSVRDRESVGSTGDYGKHEYGRESIPDSEYDKHEKNNDTDTRSRMDHQHTDDDNADTSQGYGGAHDNEYKR